MVGDWVEWRPALRAASVVTDPQPAFRRSTQSQLQPIVREAIARWTAAGLDAAAIEKLAQVQFVISRSAGFLSGRGRGNRIYLDATRPGTAGSSIPRRRWMKSLPRRAAAGNCRPLIRGPWTGSTVDGRGARTGAHRRARRSGRLGRQPDERRAGRRRPSRRLAEALWARFLRLTFATASRTNFTCGLPPPGEGAPVRVLGQ